MQLGPGYSIIAVRSEWFGDDLDYRNWIGSTLRADFFKSGGVEIVIPRLRPWILADLDESSYGFAEGVSKLGMLEAPVLRNWLTAVEGVLTSEPVASLLGLSDTSQNGVPPKKPGKAAV